MATRALNLAASKLRRIQNPAFWLLALSVGCGSKPDDSVAGSGGNEGVGGTGASTSATGGSAAEGSGGSGTGGTGLPSSGGGTAASGGAMATGGLANTGGASTSGGAAGAGGAPSSGGGGGACDAQGEITFVATFDASVDDGFRAQLSTCIATAGALWNELLTVPFDATLEVRVSYDPSIPTANSRSTTTVEWDAASKIYEVSAAYEIRTGVDPNGTTEDIQVSFGAALTDGTYWFDPDPTARTATIPAGKVDVLSTCTHELGHALGFSGARSASTGQLPGYSFRYDEHSASMGDYYYFTGTEAVAAYGSPVPETAQIFEHLGNVAPGPGADLDLDLMHGTPTRYQQRYYPTAVDGAILADLGLPVTGTPAADTVCNAAQARSSDASQARSGASASPRLGPAPHFVE